VKKHVAEKQEEMKGEDLVIEEDDEDLMIKGG